MMEVKKVPCYVIVVLCCVLTVSYRVCAQWGGPGSVVQYQVKEEQPSPKPLGNIVTDAHLDTIFNDVLILKSLQFNFLPSSSEYAKYFTLDPSSGLLSTAMTIDRETICPEQRECYINLDIAVQPSEYFRLIKIQVEVLDVNDSPPRFPQKEFNLEISEATLQDTTFTIPTASDLDSPPNGVRRYTLGEDYGIFQLDVTPSLGISGPGTDVRLVLTGKLDRELLSKYSLIVYAQDGALPPHRDAIQIHIMVLDANDNIPQFTNKSYEVTLLENTTVGSEIIRVRARDRDLGVNGDIQYRFATRTEENHGDIFNIDNNTGRITLESALNYDKAPIYHLVLQATDRGPDPNVGESSLIVTIKDVNNHKPSILVNTLTSNGHGEVSELAPVGTFVAYVSISDQDSGLGGSVDCRISNTNKTFKLVEVSEGEYKIQTRKPIDRENRTSYAINLLCKDNGLPPLSTNTTVPVRVLDENDHSPIFTKKIYNFTLKENNKAKQLITTIKASDRDTGKNAKLQYSLKFNDPTFAKFISVDPNTGGLVAKDKIDYETIKLISFRIIAVDGGKKNSSALVNIAIQDENDNRPIFVQKHFNLSVPENRPMNSKVNQVSANDLDGKRFDKFTFSLQGNQLVRRSFEIHPLSGQITTKRILNRERKSRYKFTVIVSDNDKPSLKDNAAVTVNIEDENDNYPIFDFPNSHNHTVYVSSFTPVDTTIAHITATDKDFGENSIVEYSLVNNSDLSGAFEVDARYGAIRTRTTLDHIDVKTVTIFVSAEDFGHHPKRTAAKLVLHINSSIPYIFPLPQGQVGHPEHLAIIVGILIGTALVIVVLIIAILLTRKTGKRKDEHRYNCRAAALKLVKTNGTTVIIDHKPVKLELNDAMDCTQTQTVLDDCQTTETNPKNSKTYLQVHQFLNIYAKDQECDSSGSGDLSITDSGRGPSEEGENNYHDDRNKIGKAEIRMISEEPEHWDKQPNSEEVVYRPQTDYRSSGNDMTSFNPNGVRNSWQQRRNNVNSSENVYSPDPCSGINGGTSSLRRDHSLENGTDSINKRQNKKKRVRISDTVTALDDNSACIFDFSGDSCTNAIHSCHEDISPYPSNNYMSETEI